MIKYGAAAILVSIAIIWYMTRKSPSPSIQALEEGIAKMQSDEEEDQDESEESDSL